MRQCTFKLAGSECGGGLFTANIVEGVAYNTTVHNSSHQLCSLSCVWRG